MTKFNSSIYFTLYILTLLICLFKPGFKYEIENALLIIISSMLLLSSFIFSLRKISHYFLIFLVISYFTYQLLFYQISASFPLIISSFCFLYLCNYLKKINYNYLDPTDNQLKNLIYWSTIFLTLLSLVFLFQSHPDRYSILNGDPNYSALILSTSILIALNIADSKIKKYFCFFCLIFVLYVTISRTALIALIIYFLFKIIKSRRLLFFSFLFIFLSSILTQYFLSYILPDALQSLDFNDSSRVLNLNDNSNKIRLMAYVSAVDMISNNFHYFFWNGARFYSDWNNSAINIPHNWFVQSIFGYGFIITLYISLSYIICTYKLSTWLPEIIPFLAFIFFFAGSLSIYALQVPVCLILIYFILKISLRSNK